MQQQEKASGFAIQLSSNLLSSKAASLRGRPVFPCLLCVPTTWCANDGTVDSTTSTPVIESTATSSFSGWLACSAIRPTTGPNTPFWRTPPQDIAITDTALTAEILVVVFCDFMELL